MNINNKKKFIAVLASVAILFITIIVIINLNQNSNAPKDTSAATEVLPLPNSVLYGATSPLSKKIPSNAVYAYKETLIGTFRNVYEDYSMPIYRIPLGTSVPNVKITNTYSGRVEYWPVPTNAVPSTGSDHHLAVIDMNTNKVYEFWEFAWNGAKTAISAGGDWYFPIGGTGISDVTNHTTTAAGFGVTAGAIIKEDFWDSTNNRYDENRPINHALAMGVPHQIIKRYALVPPAIQGEDLNDNTGSLPMGALFAIPKDVNVDSLAIHPLSKAILRAARDYGIYINDRNSSSQYNNTYVGTIRVEPGLTQVMWGKTNDALLNTIQGDIYNVLKQYGLYRIVGVDYSYITSSTTACTSYTYTPWDTCTNGVQLRSVIGLSPDPCFAKNPIVEQSCGGTTTCTSFTYSVWGTCSNGTQTRTVTSSSPAGCTGGNPVLTQTCTTSTNTVLCNKADVNGDSKITIQDMTGFSQIYNKSCSDDTTQYSNVACGSTDQNYDKKIDILDLALLARKFGLAQCQ